MSSLQHLAQRVAALEEEQRRQREFHSPQARRRRLEEAADQGVATLAQYAELLKEEIEETRANALGSTPLWVACQRTGIELSGLPRALICPPSADLPAVTADLLESLGYTARQDLSLPRKKPFNHRHWDSHYSPETREAAALCGLAFGDDAGELRRAAWTRRDPHAAWMLSQEAVTAARATGILRSEVKTVLGPAGVVNTAALFSRGLTLREEDWEEGEEPWVTYATLTALVEEAVGGSNQLK